MDLPESKGHQFQHLWIVFGEVRVENARNVTVKEPKLREPGGEVIKLPKDRRQRKLATQMEPISDTEVGIDEALAGTGDENGSRPVSYIMRANAHVQTLYNLGDATCTFRGLEG
jgi:hypothetical protein